MVRSRSKSQTRSILPQGAQKLCQVKKSDTRLAQDTFGYKEVLRLDSEAKGLLTQIIALMPNWNEFTVFLPSPTTCVSCKGPCAGHGDRGSCFYDSPQDCLTEVLRLAELVRRLELALLAIQNPQAIAPNAISLSLLELLPRARALLWLEQVA